MNSPWGHIDNTYSLLPGICWVETPGHGGLRISSNLRNKFSSEVLEEAIELRDNGQNWLFFEEDCDWALPVIEMPEIARAFEDKMGGKDVLDHAYKSAQWWHIEYCLKKKIPVTKEAVKNWTKWDDQPEKIRKEAILRKYNWEGLDDYLEDKQEN